MSRPYWPVWVWSQGKIEPFSWRAEAGGGGGGGGGRPVKGEEISDK